MYAKTMTKVQKILSSILITLFLCIGVLLSIPNSALAFTTADYCMDTEEQEFLRIINDYRVQNGLVPYVASQTLGAAARFHSIDMGTANYVAHMLSGPNGIFESAGSTTPLGDDITWSQNILNFGYTVNAYKGENVAGGYWSDAAGVFLAWKNSPGHNGAMLTTTYKAIGIGRFNSKTAIYPWYWTTTFGSVIDAPAIICGTVVSPSPTASPTPTITPTPLPQVTIIITPTATPLPTSTPIPSPTPTPLPTDSIPPTVSITNPLNGATVAKRAKVTLTATASDNIGVTKVDFLVNGTLKCSSLLSPYSCIWKVPSGKVSNYTIEARAYDAAGNFNSHSITVKSN